MRKKDFWLILCTVALVLVLTLVSFARSALPTSSWGLTFQHSGQTPSGPADSKQLSLYDAAYAGSTEEPVLYLTFDAGYENGYTAQILDTLKKHDVKAAFFLVGNYLQKNADLVRRMVKENSTIS